MGTGTYFSDTVKRNTSRSRSRRRRRGGPTGPLRIWTVPISTSPNSKTVLVIRLLGFGRKSSQFVAETKDSTMGVTRGTHTTGVEKLASVFEPCIRPNKSVLNRFKSLTSFEYA